VEALRGRLSIESEPGEGTTIRLWLPSVLALDEVVLVSAGTERYAIPQAPVVRVSSLKGAPDVPVLDLRERLGVPPGGTLGEHLLLVCHRAGGVIGLLVDGVVGRDEQVIRPLPRRARQPGLLGAIAAEDGQVVLVLDLDRL
jgi:two-component system chemotaxis sensor kinase CheA